MPCGALGRRRAAPARCQRAAGCLGTRRLAGRPGVKARRPDKAVAGTRVGMGAAGRVAPASATAPGRRRLTDRVTGLHQVWQLDAAPRHRRHVDSGDPCAGRRRPASGWLSADSPRPRSDRRDPWAPQPPVGCSLWRACRANATSRGWAGVQGGSTTGLPSALERTAGRAHPRRTTAEGRGRARTAKWITNVSRETSRHGRPYTADEDSLLARRPSCDPEWGVAESARASATSAACPITPRVRGPRSPETSTRPGPGARRGAGRSLRRSDSQSSKREF